MLDGARGRAEDGGSQVLLLSHDSGAGLEKVDGVVISDLLDQESRNAIPPHLPVICLSGAQRNWASIVADEYSGMKQATEHLLALGHRRIAYLHGRNTTNVPLRVRGYRDALCEAGIVPQKNWLHRLTGKNDFGPEFTAEGHRRMAGWLNNNGPSGWHHLGCTALLCHNDETALGALQALGEAGLKVPDDVSVIGFDGTEVGEYCSPQLTSVEMPLKLMGEVAIELLQKQIAADEVLVECQILPTQLRVRQSTAAPPQTD